MSCRAIAQPKSKSQKLNQGAIVSNIVPFQDMQSMSSAIAKSGLFGMKSPDQALALMLVAQAEGMHPATITQDYDIIQGKACRKTHSVLARFQQAGGKVEWHQLTDAIAEATFSHPSGGALKMSWTFEQAKKAGLTNKDNWRNYPRAMLRARVIAEAIRTVYPAAIGGMLLSEEAQDIAPLVGMSKSVNPDTGEIEAILFDVTAALDAVEDCQTLDDLSATWKAEGAKAVAAKDNSGHAALKAAVKEKKAALESVTTVEMAA
jgi:hypothetical protein